MVTSVTIRQILVLHRKRERGKLGVRRPSAYDTVLWNAYFITCHEGLAHLHYSFTSYVTKWQASLDSLLVKFRVFSPVIARYQPGTATKVQPFSSLLPQ